METELKEYFKTYFNYELTEEDLGQIMQSEANASSKKAMKSKKIIWMVLTAMAAGTALLAVTAAGMGRYHIDPVTVVKILLSKGGIPAGILGCAG